MAGVLAVRKRWFRDAAKCNGVPQGALRMGVMVIICVLYLQSFKVQKAKIAFPFEGMQNG